MEAKLSEKVLNFYRMVSGDMNVTYFNIRKEFVELRISEPLVHSSGISGKIPMNRHILDQNNSEASIGEILGTL